MTHKEIEIMGTAKGQDETYLMTMHSAPKAQEVCQIAVNTYGYVSARGVDKATGNEVARFGEET